MIFSHYCGIKRAVREFIAKTALQMLPIGDDVSIVIMGL